MSSSILNLARQTDKCSRTGVFHVIEEPFHGNLGARVTGRNERLLASNKWEAHTLQLSYHFCVELLGWRPRARGRCVWKFFFAWL